VPGKTSRFPSDVARPIVDQPLRGTWQTGNLPKALAHRLHYHIPNQFAPDSGSGRGTGDRLPIAAIGAEGHPRPLAAGASDLKAIGAVPLIAAFDRDHPIGDAHRRRARVALQQP